MSIPDLCVARPNPKGAPSAARGASSWVADLEAYSLYCFRAPWACCCPHACFGLFGSGLNVRVSITTCRVRETSYHLWFAVSDNC